MRYNFILNPFLALHNNTFENIYIFNKIRFTPPHPHNSDPAAFVPGNYMDN